MSNPEVIGYSLIGLSAFFSLFIMLVKLIITPVNDLSSSVNKLESTLQHINNNHDRLEKRINSHSQRLDDVDIKLARNKIV